MECVWQMLATFFRISSQSEQLDTSSSSGSISSEAAFTLGCIFTLGFSSAGSLSCKSIVVDLQSFFISIVARLLGSIADVLLFLSTVPSPSLYLSQSLAVRTLAECPHWGQHVLSGPTAQSCSVLSLYWQCQMS